MPGYGYRVTFPEARQERAVCLITFVPAFFSIIGSSLILHSIKAQSQRARGGRNHGALGTYERIILAMSVYDVVASVVYVLQPFLTPGRIWPTYTGNATTCRVMGTIFQVSSSAMIYYGMLSYYYLLTIRFKITPRTMANQIEPCMHIFAIGWPLVCGIAGAIMDWYDELSLFPGCWIDNYPKGCSGGSCKSPAIAWATTGWIAVVIIVSLCINNTVISLHVRKSYGPGKFTEERLSGSMGQTAKRIRLVSSQASLYVGTFFLTYIWFIFLQIVESLSYNQSNFPAFPFVVLQALFTPAAGFFNALIFFRPRYLSVRGNFCAESRFWAMRRSLFGVSVRPTADNTTRSQGGRSSIFLAGRSLSLFFRFNIMSRESRECLSDDNMIADGPYPSSSGPICRTDETTRPEEEESFRDRIIVLDPLDEENVGHGEDDDEDLENRFKDSASCYPTELKS